MIKFETLTIHDVISVIVIDDPGNAVPLANALSDRSIAGD